MGLAAETAKTNPLFETAEENDIDTTTETKGADAPKSAAPETTAVTKPQSTAPVAAKTTKKFVMALAEQKDAFPPEVVSGLSRDVPRIKGEQGAAYIGIESLGTKFRIEVESWNLRWLISPGVDNKDPGYEESKQYIRNSYDKETLEDGTPLQEYLAELNELGYTKAGISNYCDIWGMVTWTEKKGDVPVDEQKLCLVQASQTSMGKFMAFCTTQGLLQTKGMCQPSTMLEVHAEAQAKGTMKYTNFSFHRVK